MNANFQLLRRPVKRSVKRIQVPDDLSLSSRSRSRSRQTHNSRSRSRQTHRSQTETETEPEVKELQNSPAKEDEIRGLEQVPQQEVTNQSRGRFGWFKNAFSNAKNAVKQKYNERKTNIENKKMQKIINNYVRKGIIAVINDKDYELFEVYNVNSDTVHIDKYDIPKSDYENAIVKFLLDNDHLIFYFIHSIVTNEIEKYNYLDSIFSILGNKIYIFTPNKHENLIGKGEITLNTKYNIYDVTDLLEKKFTFIFEGVKSYFKDNSYVVLHESNNLKYGKVTNKDTNETFKTIINDALSSNKKNNREGEFIVANAAQGFFGGKTLRKNKKLFKNARTKKQRRF